MFSILRLEILPVSTLHKKTRENNTAKAQIFFMNFSSFFRNEKRNGKNRYDVHITRPLHFMSPPFFVKANTFSRPAG
jgi:hypothetical protein